MRYRAGKLIGAGAAAFVVAATAVTMGQAPAQVPRTKDGKPNFTGIWQAMNTANWDVQSHAARMGPVVALGAAFSIPAGVGVVDGDEIPYQPAALAKKKENYEKRAALDPEAKCYLPGVPRLMYMPFPFQIIQTPNDLTMLFEYVHAVRFIFTNGTPHPRGPIEWWLGDSRGRWEGDTLVVDAVHFNNQTWFDRAGNFHSEALHLVERYTLIGPDHIQYDVTIEDPKVFTRPWNMSMVFYRHKQKNMQLFDYECYAFDLEKYYPYPEMRAPQ